MPSLDHHLEPDGIPGFRRYVEPDPAIDVAAVDRLLDDLAAWLGRTELLADELTRQAFARELGALRRRRDALRSPLLVALAGGTGVGKSTLLNALAGAEVAVTGQQRPTTSDVTAYTHQANLLALDPQLVGDDQRVVHQRDELRDKVLLDLPDCDSHATRSHPTVHRALAAADVVVWVTSPQKYADVVPLEWLRQYRDGRRFIFVMNRADQGLDPAVVDDFVAILGQLGIDAPEVLAMSALAASTERLESAGAFSTLVDWLAEELDEKQIKAIKQDNLLAEIRGLLGYLLEATPADLVARCDRWRVTAEQVWSQQRGELAEHLATQLERDPRLRAHVEYWLGFSVGGPVGLALTAVYGLRAVFAPAWPRLWELSEAPDLELIDDTELTRLAARLDETHRTLRNLATEAGLTATAANLPESDGLDPRGVGSRLREGLREVIGRAVRQARETHGRRLRPLAWLLNLPTLALLLGLPAAWLWDQLRPVFGAGPPLAQQVGWAAVILALVLWLAVVTQLAQFAVRRQARRFLLGLRQLTEQGLDTAFRRRLLGRVDEHVEALREQQRRLEDLRQRYEDVNQPRHRS